MAFAPDGTLYLMDSQERLYIINKSNGNITSLGQVTGLETGELGGTGDFAFAPDGTLYVATYRSLYTLDLQTKKATLLYTNMLDIPVSGRIVWTGLAYCNGFLYGSHAEEATGLSAIFRIDPATGQEILLFYLSSVLNDLSSCAVTTPSSNIPPVANDQSLTTAEDTPVTVPLTANDANSDPLSFNIITSPTNGVLSGSAPNLTYTPNAGFSGSDSFIFKANDGTADSNTATVTITVAPTNDAPVADNQNVSTAEDTPVTVTLTANDANSDPLSFNIIASPTNGVLSGSAPNLTYTPNAGFSGSDSFTFKANDGTADSNIATVSITVNAEAQNNIIIYGANGYNQNDLFEIDLTQNSAEQLGDLAFGTQAIDQDPETGYVYYYEWRTDAKEFAYWNPTTGTSTIVRTYSPKPGFYGHRMAFAPDGTLYMMDDQERLYTIDKSNGNITSLGQVTGIESGPYGGIGDFAFAPNGTLYVVLYRSLYTLDIQTRTATLLYDNMIDVQVSGVLLWSGLAYCDSSLYAAHIEEATGRSAIFRIDPATGQESQLFYLPTFVNDLSSCSANE
ncbi:MAG: tandem-95 repeat protein [Anaerolineae bacterium]|nr:tandem-95 repeat protein [Anaerolineae bacterium]